MFGFIWWLMIGLVAGGLARLFMPGQQPMGLVVTMLLGLVGSVVGGVISMVIFGYNASEPGIHLGGVVMATLGAFILLAIYLRMTKEKGVI